MFLNSLSNCKKRNDIFLTIYMLRVPGMCVLFSDYFISSIVSNYEYEFEKKTTHTRLPLQQVAILGIHIFAAVELSPLEAGAEYLGYSIWHDSTDMTAIATCQSQFLKESIYVQVIFKQSCS